MADRRSPSYPPVGDDDRFDRIVARGQSLKRRRQLTRVAGAGGAFAVVALVAAMAVSLGSAPDADPVADDPPVVSTPTTTSTTLPDKLTIEVVPDVSPLQIEVTDPEQPVGEGTRQCLGISVYESKAAAENGAFATHEGWDCGTGDGGAAAIPLRVTEIDSEPTDVGVDLGEGVAVGPGSIANVGPCSVSFERIEVQATRERLGETTFTVTDLPAGSHWVVLSAVSGIGDGCDVENAPYERENSTTTSQLVNIP